MIKKTIKNKACKFYDTTNTKCTTSNEERSTNIAHTKLTHIVMIVPQVITIRTNISTMCAPTFTTSNVHAILGTNFWV
ncbi:hypothetical protein PFUGPA_01204 [Plasmodium falciparum Palo Alto/Uganda]|uniref:Uncharacterized protein n=1 Tax=Plasmodium falciparum (isolate Palo Alto / Uganda) TaxID=57270 RepID=W4J5B7_PLAFP|nr:hypothetical protein PFUGPA_01204 [Plasmodium falciparum Palo Alto/Uganda]